MRSSQTISTIRSPQAEAMRATGARRLIHGHTHRPAIHQFDVDGAPAERVVMAPWYESASCVAVDAAGAREVPLQSARRAGVEAQFPVR